VTGQIQYGSAPTLTSPRTRIVRANPAAVPAELAATPGVAVPACRVPAALRARYGCASEDTGRGRGTIRSVDPFISLYSSYLWDSL